MKPNSRHPDSPNTRIEGPITAETYVEKAKSFIRFNGNVGFVIRSDIGASDGKSATPQQWRSWMAYFAQIGVKTAFTRRHGVATVPTEWPWQFDAGASSEIPPEPVAQPKRRGWPAPEAIDRRMGQLAAGLKPPPPEYRRNEPVPSEVAETPKQVLDRVAKTPGATFSDEARAKFGLPPSRPIPDAAE